MTVSVHVGPVSHPLLELAVLDNGGALVELSDAEVIIWTDPFNPSPLMGALTPGVRWVSLPVAGVDRYIAAGIINDQRTWTATKGVYGDAVSEHAVALLLSCSRHIIMSARRSSWSPDPGWRLRGETVAVLGTGGIGIGTADKLRAFGARVIGVNRRGNHVAGFSEVLALHDLQVALEQARAAIIALPYTTATKGLITAKELDALGPKGILVNVARGEIVDTDALVIALKSGSLGAAALDVTDPEPLPDGHPLWSLSNVIVTPHTGNPFSNLPWEPNVVEYAAHIGRNVRAFSNGQELEGTVDLNLGY